jgi:peptidoglycan/LPS O-acetylase OafA/YrhL
VTHIGFQSGAALQGPGRSVLARLDVGVAVFFVLSGFLLHLPQARSALHGRALPAVTPYLWRRALRILPAYWAAVVFALLVVPGNATPTTGDWVRHLTLTQIYGLDHLQAGLTHTWSLATEVTFYLALPLLGRLAGRTLRRQLLLCGAMFATGLVWQGLVATSVLPRHAGFWLPGHADWFALGMALAALAVKGVSWLEPIARDGVACWVGAAALFVVAGTPLAGPYDLSPQSPVETLTRTLLYGAVAVLVLLPATLPEATGPVGRLLASPPAAWLGRISYGIFLFHLALLAVASDVMGLPLFTGQFWRITAVVVPGSLLVAWLSLHLIENPAMKWKRKGPGAPRTAATEPALG